MKWINASKALPIKGEIKSLQNVIVREVGAIHSFIIIDISYIKDNDGKNEKDLVLINENTTNLEYFLDELEWLKEYSEEEINEMQEKWVAYTQMKPLTGNQHKFMRFLLEYQDEISQIGDLESVFIDLQRFLKNR